MCNVTVHIVTVAVWPEWRPLHRISSTVLQIRLQAKNNTITVTSSACWDFARPRGDHAPERKVRRSWSLPTAYSLQVATVGAEARGCERLTVVALWASMGECGSPTCLHCLGLSPALEDLGLSPIPVHTTGCRSCSVIASQQRSS